MVIAAVRSLLVNEYVNVLKDTCCERIPSKPWYNKVESC